MTYQQLIVQVAEGSSYTRRELRKILRLVSSAICTELATGGEVVWNGFGSLKNVPRPSHFVKNPFTRVNYWTEPSRRVKFTPSVKMRKQVRASTRLFQEPDLIKKYLPKGAPKMDKYAVQIDPKKVEKEKNAEKGKVPDDPNCNIPLDPKLGSLPFEKDPESKKRKEIPNAKSK
jgi:nucleoid DNA-binding protein